MATSKQAHTYTHTLAHCSPASVGLAQACPNEDNLQIRIKSCNKKAPRKEVKPVLAILSCTCMLVIKVLPLPWLHLDKMLTEEVGHG